MAFPSAEAAAELSSEVEAAWLDIWNNDTVDADRKQRLCVALTAALNAVADGYGHTPAMFAPGGSKVL